MTYRIYDSATDESKALRIEIFVKEQNVPLELEIDERDKPGMAKHLVFFDNSILKYDKQ